MCVTFCHRCEILFFNHEDCPPQLCPVGANIPGTCTTCRHRQGGLCGLTRAPLPEAGGCCHQNVAIVSGEQPVTMAMCTLLGAGSNETVVEVLAGLDAPFTVAPDGQVLVDPAALGLPDTYGLGTA